MKSVERAVDSVSGPRDNVSGPCDNVSVPCDNVVSSIKPFPCYRGEGGNKRQKGERASEKHRAAQGQGGKTGREWEGVGVEKHGYVIGSGRIQTRSSSIHVVK